MKMIHLTMVLAKKVSISSDPANVLLSYLNACLSNIFSMNMRSFFDCFKNLITYKIKKTVFSNGNYLSKKNLFFNFYYLYFFLFGIFFYNIDIYRKYRY